MKIEVGRKDTVDLWRPFCASEDLGSVSRTHVSTEDLEPGSNLGFVSLEGRFLLWRIEGSFLAAGSQGAVGGLWATPEWAFAVAQPLPEALFHPSELSLNVTAHESVPLHRPCACLPPLCSPLSVVFYALLGPVLLSVPPQVVNFVRVGAFSRSPLYPPCLASWRRKVNPGNESVSSSREGFPRASLGRWRSRPWGHEDAHGLPAGFGGLLCSCSGWGLSPSGCCPQSSLASFQVRLEPSVRSGGPFAFAHPASCTSACVGWPFPSAAFLGGIHRLGLGFFFHSVRPTRPSQLC